MLIKKGANNHYFFLPIGERSRSGSRIAESSGGNKIFTASRVTCRILQPPNKNNSSRIRNTKWTGGNEKKKKKI